ncbi:MAG TPA: recombinase family protein [Symbiobacteriaceae bacterium]|jgi:site-specific DNA recombinase
MEKAIRPDRVAIYIRWSTEEQAEGTTLVEQREGCELYLRSQGWFLNPELVFIDDGYSGGNLERPGMRQLRELIQRGEVDCIVVFKIDRLSRNIVDATQLVLVEWKDRCHLRCVRQPIDTTSETGRMIFSILATFADFERAQITERTFQGRLRRIKEGQAYGGPHVPFGLMATGVAGVRALDPEKAPIVAEMYRKVREERASPFSLATWLEEQGVAPPNKGKQWRYNTIRHILSNPIYAGRLVYGRDAHLLKMTGKKHSHVKRSQPLVDVQAVSVPAIVSQAEFDDVQAVIQERAKFHTAHRRASDGTNLLSGIAHCPCGGTLSIHYSRGTRYYWCNRRATHGPNGCTAENGVLHAERVDQAVVTELLSKFGDHSRRVEAAQMAQAQTAGEVRNLERERVRIKAEVTRIDSRLGELRAAASLGDLSLKEWRDLRETLEQKREVLAAELSSVEATIGRAAAATSAEQLLILRMSNLDRWSELPPAEQKSLLSELAERIELFKPRGWKQKYQVDITWRYASVEAPAGGGMGADVSL